MLPGFLTTALEIIIILDVCGAIAYFTISGLMRIKDKKDNTPSALPNPTAGMPALAPEGLAMPAILPARISAHVYHPVAAETAPQEPPQKQWTAGLRQRITTMTRKFTYRPTNGGQAVQTQSLDTDYAKLGRVLDSFKEET
jgi:hypothetical protein